MRQLLQRFRTRRQHLAIVLDEYGGTAGVVALEDLLEEIVGDVQGPFDKEPELQPQADGSILIDGLMLMEDVNSELGLDLHDPHYDTIAGYILGRLGRMARAGDLVSSKGVQLSVHSMDGHRIAQVLLTRTDSSRTVPALLRTLSPCSPKLRSIFHRCAAPSTITFPLTLRAASVPAIW